MGKSNSTAPQSQKRQESRFRAFGLWRKGTGQVLPQFEPLLTSLTVLLNIANQLRFVLHNIAISVSFDTENPFAADGFAIRWERDKSAEDIARLSIGVARALQVSMLKS
jgi:hypothetical protein